MALGWNEGSVGVALGTMGFTALLVQTFAGDVIDKTHLDRRTFLTLSASATAFSASVWAGRVRRCHGVEYTLGSRG